MPAAQRQNCFRRQSRGLPPPPYTGSTTSTPLKPASTNSGASPVRIPTIRSDSPEPSESVSPTPQFGTAVMNVTGSSGSPRSSTSAASRSTRSRSSLRFRTGASARRSRSARVSRFVSSESGPGSHRSSSRLASTACSSSSRCRAAAATRAIAGGNSSVVGPRASVRRGLRLDSPC